MSGIRDERFLSEEAQEALKIEKRNKREMENLHMGYVPVKLYTQLVGGQIVEMWPDRNEYLFMERNMSVIHRFKNNPFGGYRKVLSQLINSVDKIYYFDD